MNKGLILVLTAAFISGFSIFINKFSVSIFDPYVFAYLKNAVVGIFLLSLLFLFKDWRKFKTLNKRQGVLLFLIAFVGGSIPFLLFFKGLSLTTAAQGAFIHKMLFIFAAILAAIFLKEKISKKFLFGAVLILAGNLLLLKKTSFVFGMGDLLILSATLLWAFENVISKYVLKELPARLVAFSRMFFGSFIILAFLGIRGDIGLIHNLSFNQAIWIFLTSILLFGYVITWYSGLKYLKVSTATAILTLGSFITTLLSFIHTGIIGQRQILSGILILGGILLILGIDYFYNIFKKIKKGEEAYDVRT